MKYLLQALESRHSRLSISDQDLKQLLSDVKDGRETRGSDDWFESLDKVVQELRSTPEGHWFLKPVSKKDVPDYHTIVKHPMDLGTVAKKVKGKQYKTKQEFKDDLNLIWDNCLLYNTSTVHPIRSNAILMKRKADHHLDFLIDAAASKPDPLAGLDFKDEDDSEDEHANKRSKTAGGAAEPTAAIIKRDKDGARGRKPARSGLSQMTSQSRPMSPPLSSQPLLQRTSTSMVDFYQLDSALLDTSQPVAGPSRIPTRNSPYIVPKTRSSGLRKAREVLEGHKAPWDHRSTKDVSLLSIGSKEAGYDGTPGAGAGAGAGACSGTGSTSGGSVDDDLDEKWWSHVSKPEMIRSGLPSTIGMVQDFRRRRRKKIGLSKGKERESVSMKPQPPPPPVSLHWTRSQPTPATTAAPSSIYPNSLPSLIDQNIHSLQKIRRAHSKLSNIQKDPEGNESPSRPTYLSSNNSLGQGGTQGGNSSWRGDQIPQMVIATTTEDEEEEDDVESNRKREEKRILREESRRIPVNGGPGDAGRGKSLEGLEISSREALEGMKLLTSTVLAHVGFEGGNQTAVDSLTSYMSDYLMNLGRTMRYYLDTQARNMSAEEMILHALFENGTTKVEQLERHVREDIERYGAKISDLAKKMQQAYDETLETTALEDDTLFAGDGEMFMSNFTEDLGEDFFGFRELGLDKEFGLSSFSVPSRLFHGREKRPILSNINKEPKLEFPLPPPLVPLSLGTVPAQLGLLQSFYQACFQKLVPPPPPPPAPVMPETLVPSSSFAINDAAANSSTDPLSISTPTVLSSNTPVLPTINGASASTDGTASQLKPTVTKPDSISNTATVPTLSDLPASTVLADEPFDPAILRKLGSLAQIPIPPVVQQVTGKKKSAGKGDSGAKATNVPKVPQEKKKPKKKETKGIGKGNWKRPAKDPNAIKTKAKKPKGPPVQPVIPPPLADRNITTKTNGIKPTTGSGSVNGSIGGSAEGNGVGDEDEDGDIEMKAEPIRKAASVMVG
ncbi:Histone acetyltransferase SAGA/ADA, catalytic subunit PCAF/GCN5 and related proteins [Phaffia rhodozyma]|uniref:Histone acetyltransferase SAGA/ADA, catalytic subunit PCAF/GCN5 and related proteins n=1 Tax=Phaffia rhodozyma TaxID=264483 RepID=A0A0F7SWB6_PHARH|nr:Histone acetyltransferase SAGA/ADA, catalytic subunit PCAF/GCN5 and related proteins [Phaffia rhodozyma]